MAGAYPLAFRPAKVLLRSLSPTFVSTSHSLKRVARTRGAQRFGLKLTYGPMVKDEWNPIVAFLDEQAGQFEKFTIVVPGKENPRGGVNGVAKVNGAQAAGAQQVNLKNLPVTVNGVFKAGDIVTFAGHLKVYEITRDANSDGGGLASVFLNTPLLSAVADLEVVTWQNVAMKVALADDQFEREWKGGLVMSGFEPPLMVEDPF